MRWLVAAVVLALAAPAAADDGALAPRHVTATLHDTHVVLEVGVRVPVDPASFPSAAVQVAIPAGAVVTRGRARVGGGEHALPLTEAGHASEAFDGIAIAAPAEPHAFAVHVTALTSAVEIEVAAPATSAVDLVLDVDASTCFSRDRRWVQLPASWRAAVPGAVEAAPAGCTVNSDGPWLSVRAPLAHGVQAGVIGGRLALPSGDFAKLEIDLPRELAAVPDDLATVIVVDASRSVTDDQRAAQRAIVASYLAHVPHSMVQVIAVARRARAVLPSWMASSVVGARIDRELGRLGGVNGSNVDAGIAEAGAWLARVGGTHRLIVLTDELAPRRLDHVAPDPWAALLPAGTVVHVVALRDGDGELSRDDDVMFGALAKATGGIGAAGGAQSDAAMLARPIAVDDIAIEGKGWEPAGTEACTDRLGEGQSCTWIARATAATGPVTIRGLVWNTKLERIVVPRGHGLAIARELAAFGGFETPVQLEIDRAAMAVDSVWSLFGAWGGRGGYADHSGFGTIGTMSGDSTGTIVDRFGTASSIGDVDLRDQLAPAIAACGPSTHGAITVYLTREEIADVDVRDAGDDTSCIEEAIWSTLVRVPDAPPHSRASFTL